MSPEQPSSKIGKSVGEKLRAARIAQNYTQSQLAAPDFSVSYISAIERGQIHPSLRALEILAGRLDLSSTQLLPSRSQQEHHQTILASVFEHDDEIDLQLLEIHLLIKQGETERALTQLGKMPVKRLKRPQQLQHRYLLGIAYLDAGHPQESEPVLLEVVQLARDTNDQYLQLAALTALGIAYAAMHNYSQAILTHQRCLNLLEEIKLPDLFEAQIYSHLGEYHTQLEQFDQALTMFLQTLSLSSKLMDVRELRAVYLDLAQRYISKGAYSLARLYLERSVFLSEQEMIKRLRREIHHYLGRIMLMGGWDGGHSYFENALRQEDIQNDPLAHASILTHYAEWSLAYGTLEDATRYARQASALTSSLGDDIIAASVLITLGHVKYRQQQYEEGDQHFVDGLAMLEHLGDQEEEAKQSARYAQLLEERGKMHEAFIYLKRAFQSRAKVGR